MQVSYVTAKCKDAGCNQGYDEDSGTLLAMERFVVNSSSGKISQAWTKFHEDLTRVSNASACEKNANTDQKKASARLTPASAAPTPAPTTPTQASTEPTPAPMKLP